MSRTHALTEWLEQSLGDPRDRRRALSFARAAAAYRAEEFPAEACGALDALGLPRWFAPAEHGGELHDLDELLQIVRTLARRDLTVVIGYVKTYLGAVAVWLAGSPEQAVRLAERIGSGAVVSLALTERDHGSDLLAGEVTAQPLPGGGYRLDGEKWLINNATRSGLLCVLARTASEGGPRGFTLLLADKSQLASGSWRALPAVPTHGVRGADISGLVLEAAELPEAARTGAQGEGLEIVLKGFQLTRTLCSGMSLGALDQALRLVLEFADRHRLYGRRLLELPHAARALAEAYADLLAAEAVAIVATRGAHTLPGELSVASAAVKYLVPTMADRSLGELRQLLGARAMLERDHMDGLFQKIERDHRIVGIFDGSTLVNLTALVTQFPLLARGYREGRVDEAGVAAAASPGRPLPPLDAAALSLQSRDGNSLVQSLPGTADRVRTLAEAGEVRPGIADRADDLARLMRSVFRRDATLGVGHGMSNFVAALPVWASGTPGQQRRAARILLADGRIAAGFTELAHGNDLAGVSLRAVPGADGLVLDGGKQLISNIARAEAAVLFARTDDRPGSRSHSHLLVDLTGLPPGRVARDRAFATSGVRGLGLGGIELRGCPVPVDSVLGDPGDALETALRAFQVSRTVLPGVALGITDTQLRTVIGFTRERRLHGRPVEALPHARATLVGAFTDLLACDALATAGARALHLLPQQTSVLSAAVKYLVPKVLHDVSYRLSVLLGARGYLREGPYAVFQKTVRDLPAVSLGHAGTGVCQSSLVPQLPRLAERSWLPALERPERGGLLAADESLTEVLSLNRPLPALDFARLDVSARGRDSLITVLPAVHYELGRSPGDERELVALTGLLVGELRQLVLSALALPPRDRTLAAGRRGFALADRYALVLAAAACLGVWRVARDALDGQGLVGDPAWAIGALHRLATRLGLRPAPLSEGVTARLHDELVLRHDRRITLDLAAGPLV
ncbi:acyl-CoA dehydrogenase [Streptomyces antarcticus]|uniref:acyl-CoA dehydrogenase n=1 Tax=Streptomyces antarcticus TaxID=2996458 RepID=UPI002270634D|nr:MULTISPECIES: acyl-CoA dehydrogenase [unclassified Streptomyces]MCY0947063.1 acyl-CoA dehydrogenase [Streptomyces sp. H34-AA3]MCZ4084770.1 acyl-CoA dehydrogenase [Streptomyces sp. H34-S5]